MAVVLFPDCVVYTYCIIMAPASQLYFTADVSILLLFSPSNLGGLWADRHQTLPHLRWWL